MQPEPVVLASNSPSTPAALIAAGLILLAGILAYANCFSGVFLFDDSYSIVDNPFIRSLWPLGQALSAPPQATVAGRPIVCLSLAVNYALGGLNPWGYHAFNLGVHLLCGLLLFGIVRRTLGGVWHGRGLERPCSTAQDMAAPSRGHAAYPLGERGSFRAVAARALARPEDVTARALAGPEDVTARALAGPAANTRGRSAALLAGLIALLWVVHPLQTESVTYVIQRCESLMGLFYLLTLYCFIRGATGGRPVLWYLPAIASCTLGMATKESMVTAPVVVLLYDAVFLAGSHGSVAPPWATRIRQALRNRRLFYAALAATWIILAALMIGHPHPDSIGFSLGFSAVDYALNQCLAIVNYLRLAFWPHPLIVDYGQPEKLSFGMVLPYAAILAVLLAATIVALFWPYRPREDAGRYVPMLGFLGAWFFVILAPTSSFVPIATEVAAERRMYLPLAAVITLVVLGLHAVVQAASARCGRRGGLLVRSALVLACGAACALGFLTHQRNKVYADEVEIWRQALAVKPDNARAHVGLGTALFTAGRKDEAVAEYRRAVETAPNSLWNRNNLAGALQATGRLEEAVAIYRQILETAPDYIEVHARLAQALSGLGRFEEAVPHYMEALRGKPGLEDLVQTLRGLAAALAHTGRTEQAAANLREALYLAPNDPAAHRDLAGVLAQQGQYHEAVQEYREALRLNPNDALARSGLELALGRLNNAAAR